MTRDEEHEQEDTYEFGEVEIDLQQFAKAAPMTNTEFFDQLGVAHSDRYPPDTAGYFLDLGDDGAAWMEAKTFRKYYEKVPKTLH